MNSTEAEVPRTSSEMALKFCASNPALVKFYATKIAAYFAKIALAKLW